ncbi:MAG: class I tRNA ligase family protein [Desulfobacterales bacterium]|nr:class I tRNA ligase family protein [Desulfobacterales bacterium]
MGHVRNYTIGDVVARYKRMQGFNVLHPMGWDAFGMPAENAAIDQRHPPGASGPTTTSTTCSAQLKRMGFSYDWDREVATCEPEYYRWEQWLFLQMYEKGLAYQQGVLRQLVRPLPDRARQRAGGGRARAGAAASRGAPEEALAVVLPDHRATPRSCWQYCDRLPGWPERVITMQKNWIGKSCGRGDPLPAGRRQASIPVFTTRPGHRLRGDLHVPGARSTPWSCSSAEGNAQEADGAGVRRADLEAGQARAGPPRATRRRASSPAPTASTR